MNASNTRRGIATYRLLAAILVLLASPLHPSSSAASQARTCAAQAHVSPVASATDDLWRKYYLPIQSALGSRQRMIQFGAVGMSIALFIIWYRQPRG
jgi:hypothetical protein